MYKLVIGSLSPTPCVVFRIPDNTSIPFAVGNTDYAAFKLALQTGKNVDGTAVELQDATGTAMTSAQIATFLATLP